MKNLKKSIAVLLAIMLVSLTMATTASAKNTYSEHTHNYIVFFSRTANCTRKGFFFGICKSCWRLSFVRSNKTDHNWVVEITDASCTEDGIEQKRCPDCGSTINNTIKATGHDYSDWTAENGKEVSVCSKCGDKQYRDIAVPEVVRGDISNRKEVTKGNSDLIITDIGDYVTPEAYGAYGDGEHDDSTAIQKAVDSGKNVLFSDGKTYYIAPEKYISVTNKKNFIMSGGTIHKGASDTNYTCFKITGCSDCVFQNMYIYSEFTANDILTPAGHTRPTGKSSNVLAFLGWNNENIKFLNNRFDRMDADYWFNANPSKGEWKNVLVDGWKSSTSIMPLFCQYIQGLEIKNANVSLSESHSGSGDHILYISKMSQNVRVHDCYFTRDENPTNRAVLLTFHGGSIEEGTNPKDILVYDCTIESNSDKALYSGFATSVDVKNCTVTNKPVSDGAYLVTGDKTNQFHFENCILETNGPVYCIGETKVVTVKNSLIRTNGSGVFAGPFDVTVSDSDIEIEDGNLCFSNYSDGFDYTFDNCNITKSGSATYLTSIRKVGGALSFKDCSINCPNTKYIMYNAGIDMSAVSFENTTIIGKNLANSSEATGYTAVNSTLNGENI